jgi:hypothetical protein
MSLTTVDILLLELLSHLLLELCELLRPNLHHNRARCLWHIMLHLLRRRGLLRQARALGWLDMLMHMLLYL